MTPSNSGLAKAVVAQGSMAPRYLTPARKKEMLVATKSSRSAGTEHPAGVRGDVQGSMASDYLTPAQKKEMLIAANSSRFAGTGHLAGVLGDVLKFRQVRCLRPLLACQARRATCRRVIFLIPSL